MIQSIVFFLDDTDFFFYICRTMAKNLWGDLTQASHKVELVYDKAKDFFVEKAGFDTNPTYNLYIKDTFARIPANYGAIIAALEKVDLYHKIYIINRSTEKYWFSKQINKQDELDAYLGLTHGGTRYRKSMLKKHIMGRDRVIYLGKNNKQYIKQNGAYVAVKDIN